MASDTWPASLPQSPLLQGFTETPPDNKIRTEMDAGPAKVRRRTTANARPITWGTILTTAQLATFDNFYLRTIAGGAKRFNITHPRTDVTVEARIVEVGEYTPLSHNLFRVNITMEFLP